MGILDDFSVEITCPKCRKKTEKKLGWLKGHKRFIFPCCGFTCRTKQFAKDLAVAEKALDRFGRNWGGMGKRL